MPRIYLSPSTQEKNLYVTGGTEEYYMNRIADAMEPWLAANGIHWTRNTPEMTAASSIAQSKEGRSDFYLALHSNAAPEGRYGSIRGPTSTTPPTVPGAAGPRRSSPPTSGGSILSPTGSGPCPPPLWGK